MQGQPADAEQPDPHAPSSPSSPHWASLIIVYRTLWCLLMQYAAGAAGWMLSDQSPMPSAPPQAEPVRSHEQFAAVWQDALHQIGDPQLETVCTWPQLKGLTATGFVAAAGR